MDDPSRSNDLSRKQFITMLGVAGALPLSTYGAIARRPSAEGGKRPICIFSKHLQWLNYDEMAETAAEIGFDGVGLTVRPRGHVLPEDAVRGLPQAAQIGAGCRGINRHGYTDCHGRQASPAGP